MLIKKLTPDMSSYDYAAWYDELKRPALIKAAAKMLMEKTGKPLHAVQPNGSVKIVNADTIESWDVIKENKLTQR